MRAPRAQRKSFPKGGQQMVTVGLYYDVRPGQEQLFEETVDRVIELISKNSGHVKSFLYRNVKNPRSYAILSEWNSQTDFTNFIRSEVFHQVAEFGKEQILEQRPRHKVYGAERELA
jgi:heme-degrading monooxygenase HmoA